MLLSALNTYTHQDLAQGKLKPEFEEGQTLYDKGEIVGIVSKITFQPMTRVHMYQFEGKNFACSALGLSSTPNGKPFKLGQIVQANESLDSIAGELVSSGTFGSASLNGTTDMMHKNYALEFFQPDRDFIQWIKNYAGNRMIIDVGCGGGRLLQRLIDFAGAKAYGIDPFFDTESLVYFNWDRMLANKNMIHVFKNRIEEMGSLFQGQGNNVLLLFARPCHSRFVETTIKMKDKETEVLYITIPDNLTRYNDLGKYSKKKVLLQHEGRSVENEEVYSIR
jgi:hypothetical protein